jgi:hypothetical protein
MATSISIAFMQLKLKKQSLRQLRIHVIILLFLSVPYAILASLLAPGTISHIYHQICATFDNERFKNDSRDSGKVNWDITIPIQIGDTESTILKAFKGGQCAKTSFLTGINKKINNDQFTFDRLMICDIVALINDTKHNSLPQCKGSYFPTEHRTCQYIRIYLFFSNGNLINKIIYHTVYIDDIRQQGDLEENYSPHSMIFSDGDNLMYCSQRNIHYRKNNPKCYSLCSDLRNSYVLPEYCENDQ